MVWSRMEKDERGEDGKEVDDAKERIDDDDDRRNGSVSWKTWREKEEGSGNRWRGTSGGVGWQAGNIFGLGENLPQVGEGMNG